MNFNISSTLKNKKYWLYSFFCILGFYRFTLITKGHFFWPDEKFYYTSALNFWQLFFRGEFSNALKQIFFSHTTPGSVLLHLIPSFIQTTLFPLFNLRPDNPHFYDIVSAYNVIFSIAISILFYHILKLILKSWDQALIGTIVYSLLCNNNIYIRHTVPYDYSLLFFLFSLYILIKNSHNLLHNKKMIFIIGIISGIALSIYHTYIFFLLHISIMIFFCSKKKIRSMMIFSFGVLIILLWFQTLSVISGRPYFSNLFNYIYLASKYIQGSYDESIVFIIKYLLTSDFLISIIILPLFFLYYLLFLWQKSTDKYIKVMLGSITFIYLCWGILGTVFRQYVYYARIIHMYIPFLIIGAFLFLKQIPQRIKSILNIIIIITSILSFINFSYKYAQINYSWDILWKYSNHPPLPYTKGYIPIKIKSRDNKELISINLHDLKPETEKNEEIFKQFKDGQLIFSKPHNSNFIPYLFEWATIEYRKKCKEAKHEIRIYSCP